jgi:hypothetical protein
MTQRFFRSEPQIYSAVLDQVNSAWGLPANGQVTAFAFEADAPRDEQGRLTLAVWDFVCDYEPVASMLPGLLASGAVEEIDAATYRAALPQSQY